MADTVNAKIFDWEIPVPQPYAEGHSLTEIEARQLNQVFRENVCNNVRSIFKKIKDGAEDALSESEAIKAATDKAASYQFTAASAGTGRSTMTPLEKEAKRLATIKVNAELAKRNMKRKDIAKEKFDANVARFAESDQIQKMAAKNLKDIEKLDEVELEQVSAAA